MDPIVLFLKAAGVGVAVAAPVGPMSLLCMRRSLTLGWRRGLATGLGTRARRVVDRIAGAFLVLFGLFELRQALAR